MTLNVVRSYRPLYQPLPNGRPAEPLFDPEDRLLKTSEAAERCSVEPKFIKRAIRRRELRPVILGPKTHRIWVSDLIKWAKGKQEK